MKTQKQYWQKLQDPRWQRKRLEILNRENFKCQSCFDTEGQLQVHHGYYEKGKEPWEYEDDTLWCFCDKCHEKAHRAKRDIDIALSKYDPFQLFCVSDALGALDEPNGYFYYYAGYVMRHKPGLIERIARKLVERIIIEKKGEKL